MPIFRTLVDDTSLLIRNLNRGATVVNEHLCQRIADNYNGLKKFEKLQYLSLLSLEHGLHNCRTLDKSQSAPPTSASMSSSNISVQLPPKLAISNWTKTGVLKDSDEWEKAAENHVEALLCAQTARIQLTPNYREFFLTMSRLPTGVRWLVDMRADLCDLMSANAALPSHASRTKALHIFNKELGQLLSIWFSPGLMNLQRLTWDSPANLLNKVAAYEAVHPLRSWLDLRRRVGPYRRCFVFTHPCLPGEPLVILHAALTQDIVGNVDALVPQNASNSSFNGTLKDSSVVACANDIERHELINCAEQQRFKDTNQSAYAISSNSISCTTANDTYQQQGGLASVANAALEDPSVVRAANIYSITTPHAGLQGIELGNTMIKRVIGRLQAEFPKLNVYTSLSPIPGFTRWLLAEISRHLQRVVLERIVDEGERNGGAMEEPPLLNPQEAVQLADALGTGSSSKDLLTQLRFRLEVAEELTDTESISTNSWINDARLVDALRTPLMMLCGRYLYAQKRHGYALDPVANFHLRNGAVLYRINWMADKSTRGLRQSCGIMVNYVYYPERTSELAERYADLRIIEVGEHVASLLKLDPNRARLKL